MKRNDETERYVVKEGYINFLYDDGTHHYWDMKHFIWDRDLEIYVDYYGSQLKSINKTAPVRVIIFDSPINHSPEDMIVALKKLNDDSKRYDDDLNESLSKL